MKSDIPNIHLTNTIHRSHDSINNQSYSADKSYALEIRSIVVGIMCVCLGFLHAQMIDCCNAQLQIPKRDILLSFEHKRDRSYCIHNKKKVPVMFHETASRKLFVFTLYVKPHMSNGVSHFNLLDELIA